MKPLTLCVFPFLIRPLLGAPITGLALPPVMQMPAASVPAPNQLRLPLKPSFASAQTSLGGKAASAQAQFGVSSAAPGGCASSASRSSPVACISYQHSYADQDHLLFTDHPNGKLKASSLKLGDLVAPHLGDKNVYHVQSHQLPTSDDPSQLVAKKLSDPAEAENLNRLGILRHHGKETPYPDSPTWAIMEKAPGVKLWETKVINWDRSTPEQRRAVDKMAWSVIGAARVDYAQRYGLIHQVIPNSEFTNVNFEERGTALTKAHLLGWGDATKVPLRLRGPDGLYHFTPKQRTRIRQNYGADELGL